MNEVARTPVLIGKASTGKDKFWFNAVITDGVDFYLQSYAWTASAEKADAVRVSEPRFVGAKNVGRSNETDPLEQAKSEMTSGWRKKIDAGYQLRDSLPPTAEPVAAGFPFLPMLAHTFKDRAHRVNLNSGVYVQAKYNGQRALYNSRYGFWSRQNKLINPEATAHLAFTYLPFAHGQGIPQSITFDGELILPSELGGFQETMRAIKKFRPELTPQLLYRVYDLYDSAQPELSFQERFMALCDYFQLLGHNVANLRLCPAQYVNNESGLIDAHMHFVAEGWEGTIIRPRLGRYTPGQRSDSLLKMKDFLDAEFEVVGFTDGLGRDAGAVVFECKNEAGLKFSVRPEGTIESRRAMFAHGQDYIGKQLTVRYQALSNDKLPIFPVGAGFGEDRQP